MLELYTKIRDYLLAGLGLTVILLSVWLYVTQLKLENCEAGRIIDHKTYVAAQKESEARALREKIQKEEDYAKAEKVANRDYSDLAAKFSATVVRLSTAQRSPGVDSGLLLKATASTTERNRSGEDPGVLTGADDTTILVTKKDAFVCAENTARVIVTQEWAKEVGLIDLPK